MQNVCTIIEKGKKSIPPPPPQSNHTIQFNENSTRAHSKKHRVYVFRDFLHDNFKSIMSGVNTDTLILDVAGGRGDLSWILYNIDGIDSIIADPRIPSHRSLVKSVNFLLNHPEEAKIRAIEGLPTTQPLAKLLPRLLETQRLANNELNVTNDNQSIHIPNPKYMRMHIDNTLVETLNQVITTYSSEDECNENVWDTYWNKEEQSRIESNKVYHGGTSPKTTSYSNNDTKNTQISDCQSALKVFQNLDLIVGFHPDQATEASVDLALLLKIPFAIVPCCVFPSEFPNRTLNGQRVKTHGELVEHLCLKHENIRKTTLPFIETNTAKNVVLYMLKEDFATIR